MLYLLLIPIPTGTSLDVGILHARQVRLYESFLDNTVKFKIYSSIFRETLDGGIILWDNVVNIYKLKRGSSVKQEGIRQRLIDGTIHVIATEGLDKASTKQIGITTAVNEAYIYRCFADKEDLLVKMFDSLDEELLANTMQHIGIMSTQDVEFETRCRLYFSAVWAFLLGNRDKCMAYIQYYYSPYFARNSADTHQKRFAPLVSKFRSVFKDEADVWMILSYILNVMLDFAIKVHNDHMPKEDEYTEHIFRVIYRSIEQYFAEPKEGDYKP